MERMRGMCEVQANCQICKEAKRTLQYERIKRPNSSYLDMTPEQRSSNAPIASAHHQNPASLSQLLVRGYMQLQAPYDWHDWYNVHTTLTQRFTWRLEPKKAVLVELHFLALGPVQDTQNLPRVLKERSIKVSTDSENPGNLASANFCLA